MIILLCNKATVALILKSGTRFIVWCNSIYTKFAQIKKKKFTKMSLLIVSGLFPRVVISCDCIVCNCQLLKTN